MITAEETMELVTNAIYKWYKDYDNTGSGISISGRIIGIKKIGEHRDDLKEVIFELASVNAQMWHEQDGIRSDNDQEVLNSIEKIHPLNQHRNDLIEEIDEIVQSSINNSESDELTAYRVLEEINRIIGSENELSFDEYEFKSNRSVIEKVSDIAMINSIIWREEDKVRDRESDESIIKAVRKMNVLNKERNNLIEGIDNDMMNYYASIIDNKKEKE